MSKQQKDRYIGWKDTDNVISTLPHYKLQENMLKSIPFNTPLFIKEKNKQNHTIMYLISYEKSILKYTLVDVLSAQQFYNAVSDSQRKRFSEKGIKAEDIDFDKSFTITRIQQLQQVQNSQKKKIPDI